MKGQMERSEREERRRAETIKRQKMTWEWTKGRPGAGYGSTHLSSQVFWKFK
jgi:hypothetical protein